MRYIIIALIFCSCYSPKKAEKQLIKAQLTHPDVVAKKTSEWYPCVISQPSIDSSEVKRWLAIIDSLNNDINYEIIEINDTINDTIKITIKDSVGYKYWLKKYKANQQVIANLKKLLVSKVPTIYKTIYIKDSSSSMVLAKQNEKLISEKDGYQKDYQKYLKLSFWLLLLLAISIILNIVKLR
jgi:hypothetical protein